jgi:hypothetical protein
MELLSNLVKNLINSINVLSSSWGNLISVALNAYENNTLPVEKVMYVDKVNGLDTNAGTTEEPFRTIAKAINVGKDYKSVKVILQNDYLVSTDEDFQKHPNVTLQINDYQLQFRRKILDTVANGGTMTQADVDEFGAGVGLYHFYNVSGLKILCNNSNIVIPVVKPDLARPGLYNNYIVNINRTAICGVKQEERLCNDSKFCSLVASVNTPVSGDYTCGVHFMDIDTMDYDVVVNYDMYDNYYTNTYLYGEDNAENSKYADNPYNTSLSSRKISANGCKFIYMCEISVGVYILTETPAPYEIIMNLGCFGDYYGFSLITPPIQNLESIPAQL